MKPCILVIKDHRDPQDDVIQDLSEKYEVVTALKSEDALSLYTNLAMKIRIVVLDIGLNSQSSFDFIDKLRSISRLPEIVVLSRDPGIKKVIDAMKLGAYDYVVYPIDKEVLLEKIEEALSNVDSVKKVDELSKRYRLDQAELDRKLGLSQELILKKRVEGSPITGDELLALFPFPEQGSEEVIDQLKETLEKEIQHAVETTKTGKVLLVEDETWYRQMLGDFLKGIYPTLSAENGEQALSLLRSNKDVDVILLDIFLPDISGTELLGMMKEIQADTEIIIITAYDQVDIAVKTLREGAYDFLNKPILKERLLAAVEKAMYRRQMQRILPEFAKKFIEEKLSYESKIEIFKQLCQNRKTQVKKVLMEDLYTFFPKLRETFIPESLPIPGHIVEGDVEAFVKELETRLMHFNPAVSDR